LIVDELFERLRKEPLCEVKGMTGGVHRIVLSSRGQTEAMKLLSQNQYTGPAPVSLKEYVKRVRAQSNLDVDVHPPDIARAFSNMVLNPETRLSPAGRFSFTARAAPARRPSQRRCLRSTRILCGCRTPSRLMGTSSEFTIRNSTGFGGCAFRKRRPLDSLRAAARSRWR
jgi:hypothetical protein